MASGGLLAWALAACGFGGNQVGDPPGGKITEPTSITYIYFGGTPAQVQTNDAVFRAFREAEPKIEVKPIHVVPYSDYYQKVQVVAASGSDLDVIMAAAPFLVQLASRGLYRELDGFLKRDRFPVADYIPAALEGGRWRNKYYTLPDLVNFSVLFYHQGALDKAGLKQPDPNSTWTQLFDLARKLTLREGGRTTQWGLWSANEERHLIGAMWSNGARLFDNEDDPKKSTWNTAKGVEVLEQFANLVLKDGASPRPGDVADAGDVFVAGQVAISLGQTWQIANRAIQAKQFTWDVTLPPKGSAGRSFAMDSQIEGIYGKAKNPDAAWRFVQHRAGPIGSKIITEAQYGVPALWDVARTTFASLPPPPPGASRRVLIDGLKEGRPMPKTPFASQIQFQVWTPELNELFNGKRSAKETVQVIDQKADAIKDD